MNSRRNPLRFAPIALSLAVSLVTQLAHAAPKTSPKAPEVQMPPEVLEAIRNAYAEAARTGKPSAGRDAVIEASQKDGRRRAEESAKLIQKIEPSGAGAGQAVEPPMTEEETQKIRELRSSGKLTRESVGLPPVAKASAEMPSPQPKGASKPKTAPQPRAVTEKAAPVIENSSGPQEIVFPGKAKP